MVLPGLWTAGDPSAGGGYPRLAAEPPQAACRAPHPVDLRFRGQARCA